MPRAGLVVTALLCTIPASAGAVNFSRKTAELDFTYQWPPEAEAVGPLDRRFRKEAGREFQRHLALAREDKKLYERQRRGSVSDFYSKEWKTAGETPRLLSLQFVHSTYTGGAHPNTDFGALIWDRQLRRAITVDDLFVPAGVFQKLTRPSYCAQLNEERRRRRGKNFSLDLREFNECPKYADLAIVPIDADKNGRFEAIAFTASPYEAGPYAEGDYEVTVALSRHLLAHIRREYQQSFEAQRQ